jgi:hypothetical protein
MVDFTKYILKDEALSIEERYNIDYNGFADDK